jgi:hypothetical protein
LPSVHDISDALEAESAVSGAISVLAPGNHDTAAALGFGTMNYYLETERYNYEYYYDFFPKVMNLLPTQAGDTGTTLTADQTANAITNYIPNSTAVYDEYAAIWDQNNSRYKNYRLPPLATSVKSGSYTLTNVPVGRPYVLFISTQGTGVATAPAQAELPYGWLVNSNMPVDPITGHNDVQITVPNTTVTVDF